MRVDVVMPQMGESIAEGTINKWLKKNRDHAQVFMYAYADSDGGRDRDKFNEILEKNGLNYNDRRWMGQHWLRVLGEGANKRSSLHTIFGPFHRFRALQKNQFIAKAREVVADLQKSGSVNPRVKRAFRGAPGHALAETPHR